MQSEKSKHNLNYYFAYGSNMSKRHVDEWCIKKGHPTFEYLDVRVARLRDYRLDFNYKSPSRDYTGAANIMDSPGNEVYGLLIGLTNVGIKIISKKEGYFKDESPSNYYDQIPVSVEIMSDEVIDDVVTYKVAKGREESEFIRPEEKYMKLILDGAEKYDFPVEYKDFLKSIKTK